MWWARCIYVDCLKCILNGEFFGDFVKCNLQGEFGGFEDKNI